MIYSCVMQPMEFSEWIEVKSSRRTSFTGRDKGVKAEIHLSMNGYVHQYTNRIAPWQLQNSESGGVEVKQYGEQMKSCFGTAVLLVETLNGMGTCLESFSLSYTVHVEQFKRRIMYVTQLHLNPIQQELVEYKVDVSICRAVFRKNKFRCRTRSSFCSHFGS